MSEPIEVAVLHPDGRLEFVRAAEVDLHEALGKFIPNVSSSSAGPAVRAWHSDLFTAEMPPNPLADKVLNYLGYVHRDGWRGTVALSMHEDREFGITTLTPKLKATIELLAQRPAPQLAEHNRVLALVRLPDGRLVAVGAVYGEKGEKDMLRLVDRAGLPVVATINLFSKAEFTTAVKDLEAAGPAGPQAWEVAW